MIDYCKRMLWHLILGITTFLSITSCSDVGSPLYLTPLLEEGKYSEAQRVSRVTPDIGNITSYSGFFTVNQTCDSHLFFWFMPAQDGDWQKAPLLYWQQGGPGISSFFGIFQEIGPLKHANASGLTARKYSWNIKNNLLMIDNPAGVGFSYSGKGCYPDNEVEVGKVWYNAIVQFYQLFPELKNNPFILSGDSYAGHYIPSYAYTLHKNNPTAEVKINLTGMMIVSGWSEALTQSDYGSYYYYLGLIDDSQRDVYYSYQKQCEESIRAQDWNNALFSCNILIGDLYDKFIGPDVNIYNLLPGSGMEDQNWSDFIQTDEIRKALHVGDRCFKTYSSDIINSLKIDSLKSVRPYVQEILEHYDMVFVNGQLDLLCPYRLEMNFLRTLQWSGTSTYLNATRIRWCYNDETVGYFKGGRHLYDVMVRGAGHFLLQDKPPLSYLLANSMASGLPGNPLHALQDCSQLS